MSSLGACASVSATNNPSWCRQGDPKADARSSDQAFLGRFGPHFGTLWELERVQKKKSVADVLLGPKFALKIMDFGSKFEPSEDDTLLEVRKCATSIFEQQSMHFDAF